MELSTFQQIKVKPFKMKHIDKLTIKKSPNNHSTLLLTGILDDDLEDSYVEETLESKVIKVSAKSDEGEEKDIFSGVVDNIKVSASAKTYYIQIKAVSHSIKLDIELVRRSFQKLGMSYTDLLQKATEDYDAEIMDKATEGPIKAFILQYDETAWQFIMRMASRFFAPLIVEDIADTPKIYVGLPDKDNIGKLDDFTYNIVKKEDRYRLTKDRYEETLTETDCETYEIYSEKIFEIANKVTFKERTLYVNEAVIEMDGGILRNVYKLTGKEGFHVNLMKNEKIIGLSIEGEVKKTETDKVKIDLDIDQPYPHDDFCWFKYSTPYTSNNGGGFYCMPELQERVRLYMPDRDDEHAYSTSCVRPEFKREGEHGIPDIKFWRTLAGKEIMFTPDGIKIRCVDNEIFINLIVDQGILLQSNKPIYVIANEGAGINLQADSKITIAAEEEFDAICNGSRINMKGGVTKIRGIFVKDN